MMMTSHVGTRVRCACEVGRGLPVQAVRPCILWQVGQAVADQQLRRMRAPGLSESAGHLVACNINAACYIAFDVMCLSCVRACDEAAPALEMRVHAPSCMPRTCTMRAVMHRKKRVACTLTAAAHPPMWPHAANPRASRVPPLNSPNIERSRAP